MKFDLVLRDLNSLKGKTLRSIKPGANIVLQDIRTQEAQIVLLDSKGSQRSRPIEELKRLWVAIHEKPAIHVDSELGGSGSSRNQPETLLANLPYIEYLYIEGKKHLAYVPIASHPFGTIKEMDPVAATKVERQLKHQRDEVPSLIIVADDVRHVCTIMEGLSGIPVSSLATGVYVHTTGDRRIFITTPTSLEGKLANGVYIPFKSRQRIKDSLCVTINGVEYQCVIRSSLSFLLFGHDSDSS